MTKNTKPEAAAKPAKNTMAVTPEQAEADLQARKAAAAAEKAEAKAAEKAQKEAAKEAAAKAKQEAAEKQKAEREAAEAAAKAKVEAAKAKIASITSDLEAAEAEVKRLKQELNEARKEARLPSLGGGSTDILRQKAATYTRDKEHKTQSGNVSVHCNDETAQKLLGKTLDECYSIAAEIIEETEEELRAKYGHLNPGMARMNLGNKIRGVLNAK